MAGCLASRFWMRASPLPICQRAPTKFAPALRGIIPNQRTIETRGNHPLAQLSRQGNSIATLMQKAPSIKAKSSAMTALQTPEISNFEQKFFNNPSIMSWIHQNVRPLPPGILKSPLKSITAKASNRTCPNRPILIPPPASGSSSGSASIVSAG